MTLPTVSIILPTYNRPGMLPRALESCMRQTYPRLEIVVVDDGSPSDMRPLVERVAQGDPRVRFIRQANQKLPGALNTGHREARGEFITWTSDDNCYDPNAIEIMAAYLQEHPDVALVYCDFRLVDEEGAVKLVRACQEPDHIWEGSVVGACFMYRRMVFETLGHYDPELILAEDYEYWLRISQSYPIAHIPGVAPYAMLYHAGSLTERHRPEQDIQCAKARAKHTRSVLRKRQFLRDGYVDAAYTCREKRLFGKALQCLAKAIWNWPFHPASYRCLVGLVLDAGRLKKQAT